MFLCKECNGEITYRCLRADKEAEIWKCKICGREVVEFIKRPGADYK